LLHQGNCNGNESEQPYINGISQEQATQLLIQKANEFQRTVNDSVRVELTQNQYDALVSFAYNVGSGNFRQSTLLRLLNQGSYTSVPDELAKWTKGRVNGQLTDLPGLVRRRNAEAQLFQNGNYSTGQGNFPGSDSFGNQRYGVAKTTSVSGRSFAQSAVNIHYPVFLVAQPDNCTCWAASSSMVLSYWRDAATASSRPSYTVQEIKDMVTAAAPQYDISCGLKPQDTVAVGDILGLTFDYPACYGVDGFASLLRDRGPLVFVRASMGGKGAHAIAIIGMNGDGTPDGTIVETMNPSPVGTGAAQNVPFAALMSMMQQLGFWDQTDWSRSGGADRVYVMYKK